MAIGFCLTIEDSRLHQLSSRQSAQSHLEQCAGLGIPHQLDVDGGGLPGSDLAIELQADGSPETVDRAQEMAFSGPQQPMIASSGSAAMGGADPLAPYSDASSEPQRAGLQDGNDLAYGAQEDYMGSVAEFRESKPQPTCAGAPPADGHVAAISKALSVTLDPTCEGSTSMCTWCNRLAVVTGPAGSAIVHLFDEVRLS